MNSSLFSVRDQKIGAFGDPFPCPSEGAAVRAFKAGIESGQGDLGKFAEDFDLYLVGQFDPIAGVVVALSQPKHIVSGVSLKAVDGGVSRESLKLANGNGVQL